MTYAIISTAFLVLALVVAAIAAASRPDRAALLRRWWRPWLAALLALMALTVVFDNVMIGVGLVRYSDARLSGLRIGLAPVEDFAYPSAGAVLLPALWALLERRGIRGRAPGGHAPEAPAPRVSEEPRG